MKVSEQVKVVNEDLKGVKLGKFQKESSKVKIKADALHLGMVVYFFPFGLFCCFFLGFLDVYFLYQPLGACPRG